jgi:hypothetical protein
VINWPKPARETSSGLASRTWTTILFCVVAVALLPVTMAAAQDAGSNTMTLSPVPMVHVVLPGDVPPDTASVRPDLGKAAPAVGAPHAVSAGLHIVPTFDVSITSDPNAAAIEATINAAIANIESQFSDPITVNITFQKAAGLGSSSTFFGILPYAQFLAALKADAKTSDDATAVGLLPNVATNPVNGAIMINVKTANLRAVGIPTPPGQPDGFIGLNTMITSPGSPGSTGTFNLLPVVEHEIDEVLGLGSSLPTVPNGTIFPQDLYRYSGVNTRSFTKLNSLAFFSIDGTHSLAQFDNQNDGGDFGDWQSNPLPPGVLPKVQDAFATPGTNPALSVELNALDVIGYDRVPATPAVTLKVNGQHPTPAVVTTTTGQTLLTLDITPSSFTAPVSWFWGLIVNNQLLWVTPAGLSTTLASFAVAPPVPISNATLLNATLSPGLQVTTFLALVDGTGSVVASDVIEAVRP